MVKIKVYRSSNAANKKYWYLNWSTYDVKRASKNKRHQWMSQNFAPESLYQFIIHNPN